jgi:GNAT superfamily N-acetyltransferase
MIPAATATFALADGTVVALHPMGPADADALQRFHGTLSQETTYLRFFSVHPELSLDEVTRFTNVDHVKREAIVAVVDDQLVAVARFDRLTGTQDAEVAFVVADHLQGRGLGSHLFGRLVDRAREVGIERFVAETLAHNGKMLHVFRHSGLPTTTTYDDAVAHVTIDLAA